jgi:glycosyltransferase involved in cell wall biosynthesis
MKILYIANIRVPTEKAHGIQVMKMCEAFAKQVQTELVLPRRYSVIKDDPYQYYNVAKNFTITKLGTIDTVRLGWAGFLLQALSFALSSFLYIRKQPRDVVIYTRDGFVVLAAYLAGRQSVFEAHMLPENILHRFVIAKATKIVSISEGLRKAFLEFYKGSMIVAPDAVDLEEFAVSLTSAQARLGLGIETKLPAVMYVGKLDSWKGYDVLLEASRFLEGVAQVVIIGGDENQVIGLKIKYPNVIFKGYLPYRELPGHQRAADVLVIPNSAQSDISRLYTSPLKIFAHMASGVPIIASDLPSIREVLGEQNALLVPPDDPKGLANGIKKLLTDKELSGRLARRAQEDSLRYSWQGRAKQIITFIQ